MRLLVRKERWTLTLPGLVVAAVASLAGAWVAVAHAYNFLAVTSRTDAPVLVVEGWIHSYASRVAVEEFTSGTYEHVFTTGGPVQGSGDYTNDYNTSAALGAARLRASGLRADLVSMAPARRVDRDRTYSAALALRDALAERKLHPPALNIITEDVHARRTRLLFQKAFGKTVRIGVIAVPSPDYDSKHWWRYSEGVRDVLGETISYLYARFLFFPPSAD